MSDPRREHEEAADRAVRRESVGVAILTISDSRTLANDTSGDAIEREVRAAGYRVVTRDLLPDEPQLLDARLRALIGDARVGLILTTGGTGVSRRDSTVEVVRRHLVAELAGFGELFRMISYQAIGAAAMMSRAVGGLAAGEEGEAFLFALPGSTNAVETGLRELILPQLDHLIWQRTGKD